MNILKLIELAYLLLVPTLICLNICLKVISTASIPNYEIATATTYIAKFITLWKQIHPIKVSS